MIDADYKANGGAAMPFMSFVTRCCKRPGPLKRCIESVKKQTSQDYEHVFLIDEIGKGYAYANAQFWLHRNKVTGKFVFLLDDDDYVIEPDFIKDIKDIVNRYAPDVIMVKMQTEAHIFPMNNVWQKKPISGSIGTSCFVISNAIYQRHIKSFSQNCGGDYHFIKEVFKHGYKIFWFDKVITRIDAAHRTHMKK